jgi:outer membrane protein OmpA-like peptidoglycan-associated protein
MKNAIIFLTALLVLWIAGCSYYYVCKIRNDCDAGRSEIVRGANLAGSVTSDSLMSAKSEVQLTPPPAYTVWFNMGANTCNLSGEDKNHFSLVKQYIDENPEGKVMITGYADNTGSESINMKISTQRAEFIRQQLLETGIPDGNIASSGKGELEPISDNSTADGRAKNRRVDILTNKN